MHSICLNSLSRGFQRSVVKGIVLVYLSQCSLSLAKISGRFCTIVLSITRRALFLRPIEKAVSLRLVICPPGRRSAAAGAAAADASATTHPESGHARVRSGCAARFADAPPPPVTPAWLQSPRHLRRPGDFRSHCHAPARLWPPESSTDSLEPRTNGLPAAPVCSRPAPCSRTFKGKAVTVGSRQTLHFSPWRSFVPGFASVKRAGSSPPSLPL